MAKESVRATEGKTPVAVAEEEPGKQDRTSVAPVSDSADAIRNSGKSKDNNCPASPLAQPQQYPQAYLPHLTPQPGAGYYLYHQPQVTPEPPSPGGLYTDVTSFLRQQAALNPFGTSHYASAIPQAPLSPNGRNTAGMIPPPSPLFPRQNMDGLEPSIMSRMSAQHSQSAMSYMTSPPLGPMGAGFGPVYQGYGGIGYTLNGDTAGTDENGTGWNMSNQQAQNAGYPQASPQLQSVMYGQPSGSNRSQSFDEMLPPSMLELQDQANSPYSTYGISQGVSAGIPPGSPMFTHQTQPAWGYGHTAEMYGAPQSPLQPRQNSMSGYPVMGHPGVRHIPLNPYGAMGSPQIGGLQFFPATSPGPPIQTTTSNKGPEGSNLFVFHIPNHFTNLDMYSLFCQYGNLLSVRIMVEKDSGRSRGFGFVSYDTPEAAAMAIKELNGFAIGNKRLKVQHKQIRSNDQQKGFTDGGYSSPGDHHGGLSSSPWYDAVTNSAPPVGYADHDEGNHGDEGPYPGLPVLDQTTMNMARTAGATGQSPLATMDPLRNALPDVTGTVE